MAGIAWVYDHVTPAMTGQLLGTMKTCWTASVASPTAADRAQLMRWFPRLRETVGAGDETVTEDRIAISDLTASPLPEEQATDLRKAWCAILDLNQ